MTALRRALWLLAVVASLWALIVTATGGFAIDTGLLRLSSRSARNPAIVALVASAAAILLTVRGRREAFRSDVVYFYRPAVLAAIFSLAFTAVSIVRGAPVAGGSDSFGYVSQAHLWTSGTLQIEPPLMRPLADLVPPAALAPLGYRPAPDRPAIVPVYPPGLPIVMAALERLGGKRAVFLTVPLLGGLTLWATFMMGTRLAGPNVGLAAALLLGTNPLFFSRAMYAESDVPATAWWAWTFALLLFPGRLTSLAAGCAAGLAILTRPNLIPLAIVPVGVLIWEALRDRSALPRHRAVLFAVGTVPAGLLLAWTNDYWYGSVLTSGHGAVSDHFQWTNIQPNLSRYPVWLLQSLTPAVGLAPAAPFVAGRLRPKVTLQTTRRWMVAWLTFAAGVVFAYLFYKPWNDVGYLRFLLPAYPVLLVLVMVAVVGMVTLLPAKAHAVVPAVLVCALAARNVVEWSRVRLFDHGTALLYRTMGEHLARRLPEPSVILSMQHSGSAQYYSGHPTVRWDYIPEEHLDKIVERLRQLGYHPYLLLEGWEEALFRRRFAGRNVLGALDWRPSAVIPPALVTLYDTNARQSGDSTPFETDVILQRP